MRIRTWLGCTLVAAGMTAGARAQSGNANAKTGTTADAPLFTLEVRRVPVDVTVTDKYGRPVKGLKRSDFIVKEDKKQQKVLSFDYVDGTKTDYVPPKLPPLPVNTYIDVPKAPERGPLYVLYYDMVNTPQRDQMTFRNQLLRFVDEAPAGVRIAIFVNAMHLELVQGFTSDHALLRQAILSKGPGPHVPQVFTFGRTLGRNDVGGVLSNLDFMAQYLKGIPGKKNLLWLASRFPIPMGPTVMGSGHMSGGGAPPSMAVGPMGGPDVLDLTELVKGDIHRTTTAMMRAQMALYTVDLSGVTGAQNLGGDADAIMNYQYEDAISAATGGRSYHSNNNIDELMVKAMDDGADYYSLSYAPPAKDFEPKAVDQERDITVTLAKPGDYKLTYRQYYFIVHNDVVKADKTSNALQARFLAAKAKDSLYADIEHGAPMMHDLLFTAHLATAGVPALATTDEMKQLVDTPVYFKTRKANKPVSVPKAVKLQKYVINYAVIDPHLKALAQDGRPPVLEFAAAAYDENGRLLNSILNQGLPSGKKGPKATTDALFAATQELEAPPGTAYIRMAVRDTLNDHTGTMEVKLPLKAENDVAENRD